MDKSTPHKARVHFGVRYSCSCGWETTTYWGKGARSNAAAELAYHKEQQARAALAAKE